jgi:YVTN family beta-propeller protein
MRARFPRLTNRADGIGVVSVADYKLLRIVKAGSDPEQTAVSQDGSRLFVANEDVGEASVVAVDDGHVLANLKVGGEPEGVEMRPDGQVVYVTSEEDSHVAVIDVTALEVLKTISVGPRPRSTAFLPDSSRVRLVGERRIDCRHRRDETRSDRNHQADRRARAPDGRRGVARRQAHLRHDGARQERRRHRDRDEHTGCLSRSR